MKDQAKGKEKIHVYPSIKKESKCFFCKMKGHMKNNCSKFKIWLDKKGTQFSLQQIMEFWMKNFVHKCTNFVHKDNCGRKIKRL